MTNAGLLNSSASRRTIPDSATCGFPSTAIPAGRVWRETLHNRRPVLHGATRHRREDDDGNGAGDGRLLELGRSAPAVEPRHRQVHDDHVGFPAFGHFDANQAIARRIDLTAHHCEVMAIDQSRVDIVVHNENDRPRASSADRAIPLPGLSPGPFPLRGNLQIWQQVACRLRQLPSISSQALPSCLFSRTHWHSPCECSGEDRDAEDAPDRRRRDGVGWLWFPPGASRRRPIPHWMPCSSRGRRNFRRSLVDAGTLLTLTLESTVASSVSRVQDRVHARLSQPIVVDDIRCSRAEASSTASSATCSEPGKVEGLARLAVSFNTLVVQGTSYDIATKQSGARRRGREGKRHGTGGAGKRSPAQVRRAAVGAPGSPASRFGYPVDVMLI